MYVACQSVLIVLVGAVPQYRVERAAAAAGGAQRVRFLSNFTSIVTEVSTAALLSVPLGLFAASASLCCALKRQQKPPIWLLFLSSNLKACN